MQGFLNHFQMCIKKIEKLINMQHVQYHVAWIFVNDCMIFTVLVTTQIHVVQDCPCLSPAIEGLNIVR